MRERSQLSQLLVGLGIAAMSTVAGCRGAEGAPGPFVVIGLDGADREVIEELWAEDRLPHLKALAERGTIATLETFRSESPVIWTTMATGVEPEVHGITHFVVPTAAGDVPASTSLRKVPAIWNMASQLDRRVAVLGWWPTWPAETVNGLVVSDRFLVATDRQLHPQDKLLGLMDLAARAQAPEPGFTEGRTGHMDRFLIGLAPQLATEGYDLLMVYLKSIDGASHRFWKYYKPDRFPNVNERELAANRHRIPEAYEVMDRAVGEIVAAAGPEANILVVSDHGFFGRRREKVKVRIDLNLILEEFGYLTRTEAGVDMTRSLVYSHKSHAGREAKTLRFALEGREPGGTVRESDRDRLRARLARDLARVTYASREPAFKLRDVKRRAEREGDFVVEVRKVSPGKELLLDGRPLAVPVRLTAVSGSHNSRTHGVILAAGPDLRPGVPLDGIRVHDVTPTLLFGLGLPVAEDFAGKARLDLFTAEFRERHPLRTIPTWGTRSGDGPEATEQDEELLEELRALGYLD